MLLRAGSHRRNEGDLPQVKLEVSTTSIIVSTSRFRGQHAFPSREKEENANQKIIDVK